jgi:hypothetical protein
MMMMMVFGEQDQDQDQERNICKEEGKGWVRAQDDEM